GVVGEQGCRVLDGGTVLPGSQYDGEPPTEVQVLEMPSEASLDAYVNDSGRLALAGERDAAIARTDVFRIQRVSGRRGLADLEGGSGRRMPRQPPPRGRGARHCGGVNRAGPARQTGMGAPACTREDPAQPCIALGRPGPGVASLVRVRCAVRGPPGEGFPGCA